MTQSLYDMVASFMKNLLLKNSFQPLFTCLLLLMSHPAIAIDLQPNDLVAPPPNLNLLTLSYTELQKSNTFANGIQQPGNPIVTSQIGLLRYARSYELASLPAVSFVQVSNGLITPGGSYSALSGSSGNGDLTFTTAIWPYANRQTRTYLGLAAYLIVPTGEYSNQQLLNMGGNRYSQDLQIGFQTPIMRNLDVAAAFDTQWFGANSQYGARNAQLTQQPLHTTQIGPIFTVNQTFTLAATYFYVQGAQTALNGVLNQDTIQTQRYIVSVVANLPPGKVTLQYGQDLQTDNGLQENRRLSLRYALAF